MPSIYPCIILSVGEWCITACVHGLLHLPKENGVSLHVYMDCCICLKLFRIWDPSGHIRASPLKQQMVKWRPCFMGLTLLRSRYMYCKVQNKNQIWLVTVEFLLDTVYILYGLKGENAQTFSKNGRKMASGQQFYCTLYCSLACLWVFTSLVHCVCLSGFILTVEVTCVLVGQSVCAFLTPTT